MTHPHERALEAAARAAIVQLGMDPDDSSGTNGEARWQTELPTTTAAVTAYLAEAGDGRLSELERENARMREALVKSEDILRRAEIDSELDALCVIRAALASLNAALAGSEEK
jgi:hypothetical protein